MPQEVDTPNPNSTPEAALRQRTLRASLWALAGRFAQSGIKLLGIVVLSRLLVPADFGVLALAALFTYAHFAFLDGLIEYPLLRTVELSGDQIRSIVWAGLGLSILTGAVLFFSAPFLQNAFGIDGFSLVLKVCAFAFPLQVIEAASRALLRRSNRFREVSFLFAATAVFYVAAGVILALLGLGYWALIGALLVHFVSMAGLGIVASALPLAPPRQFDLAWARETALRGGLSKLLFFGWEKVDTLVVGLTFSPALIGIYARAYNLSTTVREVFGAIDHPLRQTLVSVRDGGGPVERTTLKIIRLLAFLSGLAAALLFILRETVVLVLLGPQWEAVVIPFAIFILGLPARVILQFWESAVLVSGDMRRLVARQACLLILIGVGVVFAAPYGLWLVASVVTGSLYASLLIPVEARRGAIWNDLWIIVAGMTPSLVLSAGIIAFWQVAIEPAGLSIWAEVFTASAFVVFVGVIALMLAPETWLLGSLARVRRGMFRRTKTEPS